MSTNCIDTMDPDTDFCVKSVENCSKLATIHVMRIILIRHEY